LVEEKIETPKKVVETPKPLPTSPSNNVAPPAPKPILRRERKRASALSLKSIHQKVEAVEQVADSEIDRNTLPKTAFTEEKMLALWNDYAEQLIKKGDMSLASILMASKPTLNKFHIRYALPNKLMGEQLERLRPRLLKDIREKLNNFSIDLTIAIEEIEAKKFVYTPQEKFEKLKELNPDIDYLRTVFKLDV
jgi:DNA polymerase-3 subunit gamma/tau